jgi:hypothetical protein
MATPTERKQQDIVGRERLPGAGEGRKPADKGVGKRETA